MLPDLEFNMANGWEEDEQRLRQAEAMKWRAVKDQFQMQLRKDHELIKRTKNGAAVLKVTSPDQITDARAYLTC